MNEATLSGNFVRMLMRQFARRGLDADRLLALSQIKLNAAGQIPAEIPMRELNGFYDAVERLARDPAVGLHVYDNVNFEDYGLLGMALTSAPTLNDALTTMALNNASYENCAELTYGVLEGYACMSHRITDPNTPAHRLYNDIVLAVVVSFVRQVVGAEWAPTAAFTINPRPADTAHYRDFFGSRLFYGQRANMLMFDAGILSTPMPARDAHRYEQTTTELARIPVSQGWREDLILLLTAEIHASMGARPPSAAELAEKIGSNLRTLQRQLAHHNLTIKSLAETCRYRYAVHLLLNTSMTVSKISERLAYAELSAFERAFRRWTGATPTQFRAS